MVTHNCAWLLRTGAHGCTLAYTSTLGMGESRKICKRHMQTAKLRAFAHTMDARLRIPWTHDCARSHLISQHGYDHIMGKMRQGMWCHSSTLLGFRQLLQHGFLGVRLLDAHTCLELL